MSAAEDPNNSIFLGEELGKAVHRLLLKQTPEWQELTARAIAMREANRLTGVPVESLPCDRLDAFLVREALGGDMLLGFRLVVEQT